MSRKLVLLSVMVLVAALPLCAQELSGGITGNVADATGALVPGTNVTVKNLDTNLEVKITSAANGTYLAPDLPPGRYSVSFVKEGFKTETHTSIVVEANRTTTVNGRLEIGAVATTVEVASTPMMNQVDTTNGYVLGENTILNTPLGTGSFTQLAILSPGVSADFLNGSGSNTGFGNQAIWANGQRDTSNSFSVNGITNNNLFNGKSTSTVASTRFIANTGATPVSDGTTVNSDTSVYASIGNSMSTPAPETLQEIRVNTAMYDASQGGKSGAYVTAITKSGTNAFHGQAFEHFQNNDLNAAPFFRNNNPLISAHDKVPKLHYNRFGGTIGGPIKKDKLFFFAAFNGISSHDAQAGSKTVTVPLHLTDDRSQQGLINMAQADFGRTLTSIDPAALKIMQFKVGNQYLIPSAQITDLPSAVKFGGDVYLQGASTFEGRQYFGDLDYNISDKDRLAEKFIYQTSPSVSPLSGSSTLFFPQVNQAKAYDAVLDNTTILRPSLTWEQKIGFVRMVSNEVTQQPANPLDLGVNIFNSTAFPALNITKSDSNINKSATIGTFGATANAGTFQNQYTGGTNLNWVHGRHTIYAGFNWDHNQLYVVNNATNVSEVNFATFADFLTGTLQNSSFNRYFAGTANKYFNAELVGAFLQDNIRINRELSVSLGLRFDYNGPFKEKYGNLGSFHPDLYQYNAGADTITNTGLVFAGNNSTIGTPGVSDSTLTARQWGLGPRIGIVWSPSSLRTIVIRTGFGMFYDRGEYFTELSPPAGGGTNGPFGVTLEAPFVQQVAPATNSSGTIIGNLDQPFAGAVLPPPVTNTASVTALVPNAASVKTGKTTYVFGGYDPANLLPYTENWTFDVQWQPLNTLQMSLGYVGSRSLHQVMPIPFNQPGIATASNPIHNETSSYGFNEVPAVEPYKTYDGGNTGLRVPYLGLDNNSVLYRAEGIADYNALQFGITKRLSNGLQFIGSYTWSHTLDEQSGLGLFFNGNDPNNLRSSYATSTYDRPHVISVQALYQLPKIAVGSSILGHLANGWAISGIVVLQSGFPYNAYDYSGSVGGLYYSSFVSVLDPLLPLKPGVSVKQATLQGTTGYDINKPFVDPNAFYVPQVAPGTNGVPSTCTAAGLCDTFETTFGSTARNTFRGPFQSRTDVSLVKETKIHERLILRFQGDAFNIFNHPSFDVPGVGSAGLYSVSSGVVTQRGFLSSFGTITRTIGSPRFIQLSMNLVF